MPPQRIPDYAQAEIAIYDEEHRERWEQLREEREVIERIKLTLCALLPDVSVELNPYHPVVQRMPLLNDSELDYDDEDEDSDCDSKCKRNCKYHSEMSMLNMYRRAQYKGHQTAMYEKRQAERAEAVAKAVASTTSTI
jgi:hypothetical protein